MPSPDVMRALVAGLIAGSATAFACTTIVLVTLWRRPGSFRGMPQVGRISLPLLGVVAMNGFLLGWTGLGLLLGAALRLVEVSRPADGLGSPNRAFTLAMTAATALALLVTTFVRGRLSWPLTAMGIAAALSFGWLLPWLGVQRP